jgi:putative oxidoreductase
MLFDRSNPTDHREPADAAGYERLRPATGLAYTAQPAVAHWTPELLSVLRVVVAFLFMAHGTQKLLAFPVAQPQDPVDMGSLMGVAGLLESIGGLLLLIGIYTRPVAFVLAGEMAVAYFLAHAPKGFWPVLNGGEPAVLYCFIFLFFTVAGAGAWSLDAMVRSSRLTPSGGTTQHHDRWATSH